MGYVITLVHGTFAQQSRWIHAGSQLCEYLTNNLPGPVYLRSFLWSGKNSARERNKAAINLRKHLTAEINHNPSSRHFVIAHSHGGNVALRAVCETQLEERVEAIVCLATPFLYVRSRHALKSGLDFAVYSYFGLVLATGGLGGLLGMDALFALHWDNELGAFAVIALISLLSIFIFYALARMEKAAFEVCAASKLPDEIRVDLLILRAVGDEASGVLIGAQFAGWILRQIFRAASFPIEAKAPQVSRTAGVLVKTCITVIAQAVMILVSVLAVPLGFLSMVLLLPFGHDLAFSALLLDINAEATPPGKWHLHILPPTTDAWEDAILRHSALYEDTRALREITRRLAMPMAQ